MLERLRTPVSNCIAEYKKLGGKIFGNPRTFHALNIPFLETPKYRKSNFEKTIKDLVNRRLGTGSKHFLEFERHLCKT